MSYWSDEAIQKRAAEAEQLSLAWKFRGETTSQLEMRLENNGMSRESRKSIELELVRRGATYIKRSYYDRPSKFFGSDGSELAIVTAGEGKPIYDWDNMIAAESAYMDEVLAKPIPKVSGEQMSSLLESQKVLIRRVIPGLISMDSISSGVQPMNKHIDHLSIFNGLEIDHLSIFERLKSPFEDYKLTKESIDSIIAADKDQQPVAGHFWSDLIDPRSIGRGLRPTVKYGDLHLSDYMGMIHNNVPPKTNIGVKAFMDSLRESGSTQASVFDTKSTFNSGVIAGDFFGKVDTSKWIAEYRAAMDQYVDAAMTIKRPYYADDIWNDDLSKMYPNTMHNIDLSMGNKCMEIPITPIVKCTEITSSSTDFEDVWKIYAEAMKVATREMYSSNPFKAITAEAPRCKAGQIVAGVTEGIFPERLSSKELHGGWKLDEMICISSTTPKSKSILTMDVTKARGFGGPSKHIKFDLSVDRLNESPGDVKKTKQEDVAETLKLLGIGAKE